MPLPLKRMSARPLRPAAVVGLSHWLVGFGHRDDERNQPGSQAIEVAMCFGWVDSKMHRYDDDHYVLRYQPRKPKPTWAARNKDLVERLMTDGHMRTPGFAQVEAAKADGR